MHVKTWILNFDLKPRYQGIQALVFPEGWGTKKRRGQWMGFLGERIPIHSFSVRETPSPKNRSKLFSNLNLKQRVNFLKSFCLTLRASPFWPVTKIFQDFHYHSNHWLPHSLCAFEYQATEMLCMLFKWHLCLFVTNIWLND